METIRPDYFGTAHRASVRQKVLIVDDDPDLCELLRESFAACQDFEVEIAETARACIEACVEDSDYDVVILDVVLPDMDGREACKVIRRNGFQAPVILLTGGTSSADEILGLDAGANDYVTKPFRFPILLARVRAQLRQNAHSA
ncbi:MAG: response regulator transcription factor, partial [Hyphomicrobiaceae bacterium]